MARKVSKGRKPYFLSRLARHLGGVDPVKLAVIEQTFEPYDRPNVHLAVEKMLSARGVQVEVEGVVLDEEYHVRDAHVNSALDELTVHGGVLTRTLLGVGNGP